jgi:hypothetical protein
MLTDFQLPPHVVLMYANKLSLFFVYWLAYLSAELSAPIGTALMMVILFGHTNYLSRNNIWTLRT